MGRDHYAGFRNGNTSLRCNSINTRKSLPGGRKNKMREIDSASKRHANPSQENGPLFRKVLLVLGVCSIQLVKIALFEAKPRSNKRQPSVDPQGRLVKEGHRNGQCTCVFRNSRNSGRKGILCRDGATEGSCEDFPLRRCRTAC